jgi:hypothetical protein
MVGAFGGAAAFNQDISSWNVANVVSLNAMFSNCTTFNQPIGGWNVARVTRIDTLFWSDVGGPSSAFNQDLSRWNTASVCPTPRLVGVSGALLRASYAVCWQVTTLDSTFQRMSTFNQNIAGWNVASVTSINQAFSGATSFNVNIGGWNVARVTAMYVAHHRALRSHDAAELRPRPRRRKVYSLHAESRGAHSLGTKL